jgi:hypothetical protein
MKRFSVHKLFFLSLPVILIAACTASIDLKTNDSKPVIVIYGCLNDIPMLQSVRITGSSPYFEEKQNRTVSNAVVTVRSSKNEVFELKEHANEKGLYQTVAPMAAEAGVTYRLKVEVDFNEDGIPETYEASTEMPRHYRLDSIRIKTTSIMGYKHHALNMYGLEEPGEDYYLFRFIINDIVERFKITQYMTASDKGFDGSYMQGLTLTYINDMEDYDKDNKNDFLYVTSGDRITLCTSRIEKGYYDFINQCQKEKNGENPFFGGPASNITTNISNGAAGYFTAFSTSMLDAVIND